jgi:hypothetical protein
MWFCPSFLYPNSSNAIITLLQPSIQTPIGFYLPFMEDFEVEQQDLL